jgi:hypothetical protein
VETGVGVDGVGVDGVGGVVLVPVGVFLGVGFFVDFLVVVGVGVLVFGVGVAEGVVAGVAAGVAAGVLVVPPDGDVPPDSEVPVPKVNPLVDPNCGGVMDRTAPNPPTVPPAIKKKRLPIMIHSLI